jgi:TP901 family phage tail tape measure protein
MTDRTVRVRLEAVVGPYQAALAQASVATRGLAADVGKFSAQSRNEFKMLGVASLAVGGAVSLGLGKAVSAAMNFDKVISNVGAVSGATGRQLGQLRDAAIEAGKATVFSASQSAQAEAELAKAGVSVKDILGGALSGSLNLAAAGQLEVADAASIAATAMVQFKKSGSDVPHIADLLAASANEAQGGVHDMALALSYVGPVAAQMGISLEQTAGTIALLANNGVLGERAGSSLRGMLTALTSPSKMAADEMQQLGIHVYDASGQFIGFAGVAGQLKSAMQSLTPAERDQALGRIFGNEQITAARVLYEGGAQSVAKWTDRVNKDGEAARIAGKNMDNLAGDLEQLRGSLETALIQGGSEATGVLRGLAQGATESLNAFASLPGPIQGGVMAIAAATGAATLLGGAAIVAVPKIQAFNLALMEMATAPAASGATTAALTGLSAGITGLGAALSYLIPTAVVAFGTFQVLNTVLGTDHDVSKSWDHLRDSFTAAGGALDNTTRAAMAAHIETLGLTDAFAKAGLTVDDLYRASQGGMKGVTELGQSLYNTGAITKTQLQALGGFANALDEGTSKGSKLKAVLGDDASGMAGMVPPTNDAADAVGEYSKALDALYASTFGVQDATNAFTEGLTEFADGVRAAQIGGDLLATSLDGATVSGAKNQDALAGIVRQAFDVAEAMTQTGASTGQVEAVMAGFRGELVAVLQQLGFNAAEAQTYTDTLLRVPGSVSTVVNVDTAAAQAKLAALFQTLGNLDFNLRAIGERQITTGTAAIPLRPPVLTGGLANAVAGRGTQAAAARQSAAAGGSGASKAASDAKKAADDAAKSREEALKRQREVEDNSYELGLLSYTAYLAKLDQRLAAEVATGHKLTDSWKQIYDERARVIKEHNETAIGYFKDLQAAQRAQEDNAHAAGRISNAAYRAILVKRFNDAAKIYGYWSDDAQKFYRDIVAIDSDAVDELHNNAERAAQVRDDAFDRLNGMLDDEQTIRKQMADSADAHRKKLADIQAQYLADQRSAIEERRKQLLDWASLEDQVVVTWGNTADALAANIRSQTDMFTEWANSLDALHANGLSDAVISMLGLDQGPQMLGQVRSLSAATQTEIQALNDAVATRAQQASSRVALEQAQTYSTISQTLKGVTERYAAEVEAETEAFLAEQRDLNDQLAQIGLDGGRSFGQAIADGLNSAIPAIRAAADAARQAQQAADTAAAATTRVSGATPVTVAGKTLTAADWAWIFGKPAGADGLFTVGSGTLTAAQSAPVVNVAVQVGNETVDARVRTTIQNMNTASSIAGAH